MEESKPDLSGVKGGMSQTPLTPLQAGIKLPLTPVMDLWIRLLYSMEADQYVPTYIRYLHYLHIIVLAY